ncbi:GNAT family N-acetyltransferase [Streptomyces sp. LX-29]|uniref:GNAT family N-acetyltransferase n=1 Tax=Streptomyces sp. LX-29 TaxID=2900152 RepID=UPI00240D7F73|nr:GNAT family N-acetyltransferase [Streptomyces sp. LX-29]WFB09389.1 GNAT family N-acetyltransferase [Streptomyces sp. LX-29]
MTSPMIKRATARDAERLTDLMHASRAYEGAYATMLAGYRITADYIAAHPVHLAESPDGELLGFYALLPEQAELDLLFVADAAQGTGLGRLLVEHMRERAREHGLERVRVVSHPPAEHFYRRMGARRTGTVPASPPKVTWERPELSFTTAATVTVAATVESPRGTAHASGRG